MLPPRNRLRRPPEFTAAVRNGCRAGRGTVVVHLLEQAGGGAAAEPPRVGLVVGRTVGPAVVRNRVKRRLRHLLRERLGALPAGSLLVVRAAPSAGAARSDVLAADLEAALARVLGRRSVAAAVATPAGTLR